MKMLGGVLLLAALQAAVASVTPYPRVPGDEPNPDCVAVTVRLGDEQARITVGRFPRGISFHQQPHPLS